MGALVQCTSHLRSVGVSRLPRLCSLNGPWLQGTHNLVPRKLTALAGLEAPPPSALIPSGFIAARDLTFLASPPKIVEGPSSVLLTQVHSKNFGSRLGKPVLRDPERPKQPLSAYLVFLAEFRALNPTLGKNTMILAGQKWRAMSEQEKRPYTEAHAVEKKAFEKSYKEYVDSGKKAAWARPQGRPKRPMVPWMQFLQDYRKKNSHMKLTDMARTSSSIWKGMKPEERLPYEQRYEKEKVEYALKFKAYEESGEEQAWRDKVGITAKLNKAKAAVEKKKAAAKEKAVKLAKKKKALADKKKALAQKKKAAAAQTKKMLERKKEAAAKKRAKMVEKKKAAAEKKKAAAEKKKKLMMERKKAAAAKKKAAAVKKAKAEKEKKKRLAEKKKAAEVKKKEKKAAAEQQKKAAAEKKSQQMAEKQEAAEAKKRAMEQKSEAPKKLENTTTEAEKLKSAALADKAAGKS